MRTFKYKEPPTIHARQFLLENCDLPHKGTFTINIDSGGWGASRTFIVMVNPEHQVCLEINIAVGTTRAFLGDWIIVDPHGGIAVVRKEKFDQLFDRA